MTRTMKKMMKEYRNYIFDFYGTLAEIHTDENKPAFWKKMAVFFNGQGCSYDWRDLRDAYFRKVSEEEQTRAMAGRHIEIDLKEVFLDLFEDQGVTADCERIKECAFIFRQSSTSHLRLYAGAKDLLQTLKEKGKGVYLLSNAQELFTMNELRELNIVSFFDDIFLSSAIAYKKPDPSFFDALIQKHHLKKDECLMIGNDLYSDIRGARDCGMDSYYIRSRISPGESMRIEATYHLDHMDLKKLKMEIIRSFE